MLCGWSAVCLAGPVDDVEAASKQYFQGQYQQAIVLVDKAITSRKLSAKNFAVAYLIRGLAYRRLKDYGKAVEDLTRVIDVAPKEAKGYNSLAWLLATCPEKKYRDGPRAVVLAKRAVALVESSGHLDTLSAAFAEAGQFDQAVATQKQAIAKLAGEGMQRRTAAFQQKLASYQKKQPWRE